MIEDNNDKAIERVARALTAVPPDSAFTTRLLARLDRPRTPFAVWLAVPAAIALVVLVGIKVAPRTNDAPMQRPTAVDRDRLATSSPTSDVQHARVASGSPTMSATHMPSRVPRRSRRVVVEAEVPAIAALTAPDQLHIDDLTFEPLTVSSVELGLLDLTNLEVPSLEPRAAQEEIRAPRR